MLCPTIPEVGTPRTRDIEDEHKLLFYGSLLHLLSPLTVVPQTGDERGVSPVDREVKKDLQTE